MNNGYHQYPRIKKVRRATEREVADYCRHCPGEVEMLAEMMPYERSEHVGAKLHKARNAQCPTGVVQKTWDNMRDGEKAGLLARIAYLEHVQKRDY